MRFDVTAEQALVQQKARDFARREIEPRAAELDRSARWPDDIVGRAGELGFLGVAVPAAHGGAGLDHVSYALVVEEIGAACGSTGMILAAHNALFCDPLLRCGTAMQKRDILAPAAAGKALGAFALTDGAVPAVATRQPDGSFVLTGSKRGVVAGDVAEHVLVLAGPAEAEGGVRGAALLVRRGAPGLTLGPRDEKMGLRAAGACTLLFEDVRVPPDHVLGDEESGSPAALAALDGARIGIAALAVGIARAALDEAVAFVKDRGAGAPPHQAVQFMISDMATEIDAARLLTLRAALRRDAGHPHTAESSMAKLFASEAATRVTHRAMQILGDQGYTAAHGVERHYRDARITEIDGGTSEIQASIVAGLAGGTLEG